MRAYTLGFLLFCCGCAARALRIGAGTEFELAPGGQAVLGDTDARLTLIEVRNDSRCPMDAVCVWAGDAEVILALQRPGIDSIFSLHPAQEPRARQVGAIRVELLTLSPPRRADQAIPRGAYRARFRWSPP